MVIKEMKIGNTIMRLHDDCMVKTEEENQKLLEDITRLVVGFYRNLEQQQKQDDTA